MNLVALLACGPATSSLPPPRWGGVGAVNDGILWTFGGWVEGRLTDETWAFDLSSQRWEPSAPAPVPMAGGGAVWDGSAFLVLAGESTEGVVDRFYRFDPGTGDWSELAPIGEARRLPAVVLFREEVYVLGGERADGTVTPSLWRYSAGGWSWLWEDVALEDWRGFGAADDDVDRLLIAGGEKGGQDRVLQWVGGPLEDLGPGLGSREGSCIVGDSGRLYLFGGAEGDEAAWSWTTASGWERELAGPRARRNAYCIVVADSLYLYGGDLSFDPGVYDPIGDLWRLTGGEWTPVLGADGLPI